ncbi:hypothetical protein NC796_07290 [Aliifodinibius sp. S!AR15-10]|uniref:hypothetical protein n=1 Tax=Aliifodinibius sp. S!AR15-10 TaxID=2950437 RepID=UPI00285C7E77|nr:hypothetical protein [Aliifodinibius sp. S!AR15-10]MDR8390935.1 hypothetical protein [Aliifodinibius sp. S!AR15-10]
MNLFKLNYTGSLLALVTFVSISVSAHAQQVQSDYQIQQEYNQQVKEIKQSLESVTTLSEAQQVSDRIDSLQMEYVDHRTLINKAVYPETFEEQISELEEWALSAQDQLATIEQQQDKLQRMNSELTSYGKKLNNLNSHTDSLETAIQKSIASEKELSDQLRNYRENLERRDQLILSFIDSVVVTYEDLGLNAMTDMENVRSENELNTEESPLKMMRAIPSESLQLLEANQDLRPEDYLRMKAVQQEFSRMWSKVGTKFTQAYSVNPQQTKSEIEQSINQWEKGLNDRMWTSLQQSFQQADIEVQDFNNSSTLFEALNTYVEQGLTKSRQDSGNKTYQDYTKFADFWNTRVKEYWTENMIRTEVLSSSQIATIDQKTNRWASIAQPESNLMAYLLGVSLFTIAVLGFMLFREKSGKKA